MKGMPPRLDAAIGPETTGGDSVGPGPEDVGSGGGCDGFGASGLNAVIRRSLMTAGDDLRCAACRGRVFVLFGSRPPRGTLVVFAAGLHFSRAPLQCRLTRRGTPAGCSESQSDDGDVSWRAKASVNGSLKLGFMARMMYPDDEHLPLLEALSQAATLRREAYRLYLSLFRQALKLGIGPSLIARYAFITPQAANSTKNRLAETAKDRYAPTSIEDVFQRVSAGRRPRGRRTSG